MKKIVVKIIEIFLLFNFIYITTIYAITPQNELKYQGIDVSDWQGYINYNQVKKDGIEIVYIKASQGQNIKDPYFEINYENAKANNLKIGFYHFLTATNINEAKQEAVFFSSVISGKQANCKLALDYEKFNGINKEEINQIAQAFIKKVEELTKKQVIIYSDLYNSTKTFSIQTANTSELWLAYYGDYKNIENENTSWQNFIGIQYTDRGRVSGIRANVDRNMFTEKIFLDNQTEILKIENPIGITNTDVIYYTVKSGDTLSKIAMEYGTSVGEIAEINKILNINLIYPGQILKIITNSKIHGTESNGLGKTYYTIKSGDTLTSIAFRYRVTVEQLVNWNYIQNPNLIYPGQRIIIFETYNIYPNRYYYYTVQKGDSLWKIARRYGVTVRWIARLNNIRNPNLIYPGQILKI